MFLFQVNASAVNYNLRNLRRCPIVEVHERLAVYCLMQDGKVCADALDIPARLYGY
jgi:hypothetical protein